MSLFSSFIAKYVKRNILNSNAYFEVEYGRQEIDRNTIKTRYDFLFDYQ